ncbi:MAG: AEC family transporter [Clostridiales Family XIII bacterium]|jgi:predicted permease|nr:AEC family transporter [Clostridiales Family XIII bacterium]
MLASLGNTAALFLLVLLAGFVAGKCKILRDEGKAGMTNLVLFVTLPCTIVDSFKIDYESSLLAGMAITFAIALAAQTLGQLASVALFRKQPWEKRSVLRYGLIVCNSGFFGMSVMAALFGGSALSLGAVYLIPQRFAMWVLGMPVFTDRKQKYALLKTFVHPCMIAVYLGLILMLFSIRLPAAVAAPLDAIGGCTMPLAMLLVGSILSETKLKNLLDPNIYFYCLVRLVVIPGIVFLGCLLIGIDADIMRVCVLMAGMPAAATTGLLSLVYGADEKLGTATIVTSTAFFFLLMPAWLTLFSLY